MLQLAELHFFLLYLWQKNKANTSFYTQQTMRKIIESSIYAGVAIGIAGFGYLAEKSIIGAVLFAFGLLTVVHYGLKLYTGTAGFIKKGEVGQLFLILLGNIVGCLIVAILARMSPMPLQETAQKILEGRLAIGPVRGGILAIGCGMIMTTAVTFAISTRPTESPVFSVSRVLIACFAAAILVRPSMS